MKLLNFIQLDVPLARLSSRRDSYLKYIVYIYKAGLFLTLFHAPRARTSLFRPLLLVGFIIDQLLSIGPTINDFYLIGSDAFWPAVYAREVLDHSVLRFGLGPIRPILL